MSHDVPKPWDLLIKSRDRFEDDLPVSRPKTEPDIALFLPGRYLILIEAKFTSRNGVYKRAPKPGRLVDLTLDQLIRIYQDPDLVTLDYEAANHRAEVHYQLWRNLIFAEYMARLDSPTTGWFHVNLVRAGFEEEACEAMLTLMRPGQQHRFEQITWEQLYELAEGDDSLSRLRRYMEQKTERLRPAFKIDRSSPAGSR
jgi:hypothetical protein